MKVLVCGPVALGGGEIRELQRRLRESGFDVIDQLVYDYSHVKDFRDLENLRKEIVDRDLSFVDEADVVVLIATKPSFGAMCEALIASLKGKSVVAYANSAVASPWPLAFASAIARNFDELVSVLRKIEVGKIRVIPNIYGEHEAVFEYGDFKCICPVTGREDRARIKIRYIPAEKLIEYESLDPYFKSFAGKAIHHEAVVETVFRDVMKAAEPKFLEVEAEFEERSGVKAIVRMSGTSRRGSTP